MGMVEAGIAVAEWSCVGRETVIGRPSKSHTIRGHRILKQETVNESS
jgi:hypothetical protein